MDRYEKAKKLVLNLVEKRLGYHLTNNPNRLMPDGIKSVTIHNTDNAGVGADADNHHRYLQNDGWGRKVSWHYTVDEKQALQHFRDDRVTWHSGTTKGNNESIGIELAMDADKAGDAMMGEANYKKTVDNAAKLTAMLLTEYGLTVTDVKQHYDWNKKNCPSQLRRARHGITWADFLAMVTTYYQALIEVPDEQAPDGKLFRVAVASFKSRQSAEDLRDQLIDDGYPTAFLAVVDDPKKE